MGFAEDLLASAEQLDRDREDARRYRWLRDTGYWFASDEGSPWVVIGTNAGDAVPACGRELDAAVDAGMAAMPPVAGERTAERVRHGTSNDR